MEALQGIGQAEPQAVGDLLLGHLENHPRVPLGQDPAGSEPKFGAVVPPPSPARGHGAFFPQPDPVPRDLAPPVPRYLFFPPSREGKEVMG